MKRRRRTQVNPMRPLILLAVVWVAGSLLFAAENPQRPAADERTGAAEPVTATVAAAAPPAGERADEAADQDAPQEATGGADQSAQSEPTDSSTQAEAPDASKDEAEDEDEASAAASKQQDAGAKSAGATPKRFVPSEQVRADFDVSFPIDI